MAAFECKIAPLDKLIIDPKGIRAPLCNNCVQPDCDNPIRKVTISIMGRPVNWRVWTVNNQMRQVTFCVGYVPEDQNVLGTHISNTERQAEASDGIKGESQ